MATVLRICFALVTVQLLAIIGLTLAGSILGAVFIVALSEALRRIEDATLLYGLSGIVLAVIFIVKTASSLVMPEFDSTLLGLMGISSGTYLGFKLQGK